MTQRKPGPAWRRFPIAWPSPVAFIFGAWVALSLSALAQPVHFPGYHVSQADLAIPLRNHKSSVRNNFRQVRRVFHSPREDHLLAIAESLYMDRDRLVAWTEAFPSRVKRPGPPPGDFWWDYSYNSREPRTVRQPTRAAVKYYDGLVAGYQRDPALARGWKTSFRYDGRIDFRSEVKWMGVVYRRVFVARVDLYFSWDCGELCLLAFGRARTVVFDAGGAVIAVYGDEAPTVVQTN